MIAFLTIVSALRHKITFVSWTRADGLQIRTNDVVMWSKLKNKTDQIDTDTKKSNRKGTTAMMILDPDKYDMSAESMLVIRDVNQPLVYASYENHHTRELLADGVDAYINDKLSDVLEVTRFWQKHFPELTDRKAEGYTSLWVKKILIPNLRRSCNAKIAFYKTMAKRDDVGKTLKDEIKRCIAKNEEYLDCIKELDASRILSPFEQEKLS